VHNKPEEPWYVKFGKYLCRDYLDKQRKWYLAKFKNEVNTQIKSQYSVMWLQIAILIGAYMAVLLTGYSLLARRMASLIVWLLIVYNLIRMAQVFARIRKYYPYNVTYRVSWT
jgi:hypothetical protein